MIHFDKSNSIVDVGFALMDKVQGKLLDGNVDEGTNNLLHGLSQIKHSYDLEQWQKFAKSFCLKHPLQTLIHQDPFTQHSFEKPRGYAGDAALLDFIYGERSIPEHTTLLGRNIANFCINSSASRSVRNRLEILAAMIDFLAQSSPHPLRILSLACGHLREAKKSLAVQANQIKELIALDQDPLSIELISKEMANYPINPICASVSDLIRKKLIFGDLDLVYAAGLYDYLSLRVATRLTRIMFEMLKPGGVLLVANFAPSLLDIGYMETFMQWDLIYRDPAELERVTKAFTPSKGFSLCVGFDIHKNS